MVATEHGGASKAALASGNILARAAAAMAAWAAWAALAALAGPCASAPASVATTTAALAATSMRVFGDARIAAPGRGRRSGGGDAAM